MKAIQTFATPWFGTGAALLPLVFVAFQDPAIPPQERKPPSAARLDVASVDRLFEEGWVAQGLAAGKPADDAEWLRRASLVLNGAIPAADEVAAFLASRDANKRDRKIDELMARPQFGEHFGGEWLRLLIGRGGRERRFDRNAFAEWVEDQFNLGTPFDQFTRQVIAATGTSEQNPAVGYVERWQAEPKDLAGQTAKVFLGVQIQCARCHDHKDQPWKRLEFNEFAAYFANTRLKALGAKSPGKPAFEVVEEPDRQLGRFAKRIAEKRLEDRAKNIKNPEQAQKMKEQFELRTVTPSPLRPLESGPLAAPADPRLYGGDDAPEGSDTAVDSRRRERLAAWITAQGNPYYSRAVVNNTVQLLLGYGLVNPVQDFRTDSTVAIPALLDALAAEFERGGYDYKELVRLLAKSKAFGLSSAANPKEKTEIREVHEKAFARFVTRPMSPEQLFDSVQRATGIDEAAEARIKSLPRGKKNGGEAAGEKAAEMVGKLRDQALRRFITTFEDDEQGEDVDFEGTIPQALLMMNSKLVTQALQRGFTVSKLMAKEGDRLDALYLTFLGRKPSSEERTKASAYLAQAGEKRESYEDLAWALLNSAEFSTIH